MENDFENFGEFLHQKRISKGVSYREFAKILGVTPAYISDIEKNRRNAPSMDKLEIIKSYFLLNDEEANIMYDLAGKNKGDIAPDILDFLRGNKNAIMALRTSRDCNASEDDWLRFAETLKNDK